MKVEGDGAISHKDMASGEAIVRSYPLCVEPV